MKNALLMIATLAASTALAADVKPRFELKGDAAKGAEVFKTFCVACHGPEGKGDGPAGAALNPKPANFGDPERASKADDEYVYKMVSEGGQANGKSPLMTAWKGALTDVQIRDVAAHVRTLQLAGIKAAKPAAPAKGAAPVKAATPPAKK
jgi:cytochrome c553